jgi:hypothetical protein|eukprot:m.421596 g.421596  ORF g.421596 m.421596 type:complete len:324 (-) comp34407_c0_seq1:104-1075(-)
MGKIRSTKRVRGMNQVSTGGVHMGASTSAGDSGLLSAGDIWAPERAAGAHAVEKPLWKARVAGRSAIPGMSLITVHGSTIEPIDAPDAMDFEATLPNADEDDSQPDAAGAAAAPAPRASTKLARRKAKQKGFLLKLNTLHSSKQRHQEIARKKANPPVVVGDVTGLFAELDEIAAGGAAKSKKSKKMPVPAGMTRKIAGAIKARIAEKVKRTTSKKGRQAALVVETAVFKATLSHPQFRMKPTATITEHIRNSVRSDRATAEGLAAATAAAAPAAVITAVATSTKGTKGTASAARSSTFKEKARLHGRLKKSGNGKRRGAAKT